VKPRKKPMKTPHVHAELIKAWADGAEIESQVFDYGWYIDYHPAWSMSISYRVKPDQKQDYSRYTHVSTLTADRFSDRKFETDNLKLTFDGETGKLKAAEVL